MLVTLLEDFFVELDERWGPTPDARIRLQIIGSTALMLATNYRRGTKDSDVLGTLHATPDVRSRLENLGGKNSALFGRFGMYVEVVPLGLVFLPHQPRWHPLEALNPRLGSLELEVLDVVDVAVSKTMRFNANDRDDIEAMIDSERVLYGPFIERFRSAADVCAHGADADKLPKCVKKNLHYVEREFFRVAETKIELPGWIDDDE